MSYKVFTVYRVLSNLSAKDSFRKPTIIVITSSSVNRSEISERVSLVWSRAKEQNVCTNDAFHTRSPAAS